MISLQKTPVLAGFRQDEIHQALTLLQSRQAVYGKGSCIFSEGQVTSCLGIVLSGSVTIERIDYLGNKSILGINRAGQVFGESYATMGTPLMVDVVANEDCTILFLQLDCLSALPAGTSWYPKLLMNLLRVSAHKNLELSGRSFHTFSKHIRGRVISYLTAISREKGCMEFDIPLDRQQMADYLNVDRSALSNELGKMRRDGLIAYHKKHFRLLYIGSAE